ncbi:MAG: B12-binding domain-containing radical SAM protein [Leptolyngbyaceae cyanobacterium MAG.088]|nr:B12-binding domain-containing radical SAM protein [Leptolyngbyaceae cyanobacterium MAG.088]
MRVLLLYPLFPTSFWSWDKILELTGRKALLPPLGLITVGAILPQTWDFKLVDRNVRDITDQEWDWAELVILSGMIVQKPDLLAQISEAKHRDKFVAVGGPYATALPHEVQAAGADYLILDEGEITLPLFVKAIKRGETSGTFRATEKPDVTSTPIPRYDLLEMDLYDTMSVQFSRGCPFQCEFCDIIVLYGRKPRTKTPTQLIAELQALYDSGWRGTVFMVDDNFIGNKRNVKLLLKELKIWRENLGNPFSFLTEASVDLAQDEELLDLMVECDFHWVFLGIETPDESSLTLTQKHQNTRDPLSDAMATITGYGIQIMAGFIIGFDGETAGAGKRIVQFVEQTAIPVPLFSMLQALPDTALWHRLQKEKRLLNREGNINQTTLMNFLPTRPIDEIAEEYVEAFSELYDPQKYLERAFRHFMMLGAPRHPETFKVRRGSDPDDLKQIGKQGSKHQAAVTLFWRQGVVRSTRWTFWVNLMRIYWHKRDLLEAYLTVCAYLEHFNEYRQIVREQISTQLAQHLKHHPSCINGEPQVLEKVKLPVS